MNVSYRRIFLLVMVTAAVTVQAQDYPFTDNFTDPAQTSLRWSQIFPDSFTRDAENGAYTLTNLHRNPAIAGLVYHSFATRVQAFTASCILKRPTDSTVAGMWVCLTVPPSGGAVTGYSIQVGKGGILSAYKNGVTASTLAFSAQYHLQGLIDTIMASKVADTFFIFCNDVFLGRFTDSVSPIPSGDLGLFIQGNASAMFGNVTFSDQGTPGTFTACMTDSFRGSSIDKRWLLNPAQFFTLHKGIFDIAVPPSSGAYGDVRMSLDTFVTRLVVSWRGGDSVQLYGSYLFGPTDARGKTPMAQFGIYGMRAGRAFLNSTDSAIQLKSCPFIKGKAFWQPGHDTVFYRDTIDVRKGRTSGYYLMYVNGIILDSLPAAQVKFPLLGAGMFCWGKQAIKVEYFHAGPTIAECQHGQPVEQLRNSNGPVIPAAPVTAGHAALPQSGNTAAKPDTP